MTEMKMRLFVPRSSAPDAGVPESALTEPDSQTLSYGNVRKWMARLAIAILLLDLLLIATGDPTRECGRVAGTILHANGP